MKLDPESLPARLIARCQIVPEGRAASGTAFVGAPDPVQGAAPLPRFATDPNLEALMQALALGFGRRHWWPATHPFEVLVGAILTQNTAWANVERALENLRALDAVRPGTFTPRGLLALPRAITGEPDRFDPQAPEAHAAPTLEALIRPSGAFRQKAKKLVAAATWLLDIGGWPVLAEAPLDELRASLLEVHGIGPETADSILCYAAGRPAVIVDAYARRILARHGLMPTALDPRTPYDAVRTWLTERLIPDQLALEETHALFVAAGAAHCKPTPRCLDCPVPTPDTLS